MGRIILVLLSIFASSALAAQVFVEQHSETYPISVASSLALRNFVGNVTLSGWDEPRVQVDWVLRAYSKRQLGDAWVEINPGTNMIDIRTQYPVVKTVSSRARQKASGPDSVDYTVHVPRKLRSIEIANDEGDLTVAGFGGDLKAFSQNGTVSVDDASGNLEITTLHATQTVHLGEIYGRRSIRLQSVNGNIRISLSRKSDVKLLAASASGGLSNDFGWIPLKRRDESGRDLQGRLGKGDATIHIEEVNGSIEVSAEPRPSVGR